MRLNNKLLILGKSNYIIYMPKKKEIYLDYAATTPVDPQVLRVMLPYLREKYGNPSSIHFLGEEAKTAVGKARKIIVDFLGCLPEEIIFTGSATEANNLAIKGLVRGLKSKIYNLKSKIHIITSMIEHHAVLEPFKALEKEGVEATYLPVNKSGVINISDLVKVIKENTVLVSIMYANNEIGVIQPIKEAGKLLKDINQLREKSGAPKIYFHTDAVQAINYLDCDVNKLGVDLLTLSAHKIYGPKGVGTLYAKKGTPLEPQISGGGQELGIRSGTENVAGIVGLGEAIEKVKKSRLRLSGFGGQAKIPAPSRPVGRCGAGKNIERLRNKLIQGIIKTIPDVQLNSSIKNCLPNIINFSFKGVEGEAVVLALDQKGICVSTGSACASRSLEPSHVLLALGLTEEEAHSSVRFSLGRYTTTREIDYVLKVLPGVAERLRKISGYK